MPLNNADNLIYIFNFHPQHNYSSDLSSMTIPSEIFRYTIDYIISSYMNMQYSETHQTILYYQAVNQDFPHILLPISR